MYYSLLYVLGFRNAYLFIFCIPMKQHKTFFILLRFTMLTVTMNWTSHTYYTQRNRNEMVEDNILISLLGCNTFAFVFVALIGFFFKYNWSNHFCTLNVQGFIWTIATSQPLPQSSVTSCSPCWHAVIYLNLSSDRSWIKFHFAKFCLININLLGIQVHCINK